jgi:hypothetical protein
MDSAFGAPYPDHAIPEAHHVASSTHRMAALTAPSSLNKFLGKAVPSRCRFQ